MAVLGFSHVAVGVRDMDHTVAFYRDVIGLAVSFDETEVFEPTGGWTDEIRRRGVYMRYSAEPTAGFLVLDRQLTHEPDGAPAQMFDIGVHHFSFWVDDVDEVAERAHAFGVEVFVEPTNADSKLYGEESGRMLRSTLMRDPEGNVVQVDQRLD